MEIIEENMRTCGVDEKMVSERLGWREKIRILSPLAKDKHRRRNKKNKEEEMKTKEKKKKKEEE